MNNEEFFKWSLQVFDEIEGSNEFNNVDKEIREIFYLMFIKSKRNYIAIQHLFNGKWIAKTLI